jgi:hypothetical protein
MPNRGNQPQPQAAARKRGASPGRELTSRQSCTGPRARSSGTECARFGLLSASVPLDNPASSALTQEFPGIAAQPPRTDLGPRGRSPLQS